METDAAVQFQIKQGEFEGPIEVLLELIEKRKLFVGDVSLAAVTDDFISYIQTHGMLPDQVAHFLAVAATLILIKARSLLPTLELTPEESESITDLERRLALYQVITHAAGELVKAYGKKISFEGPVRPFGPVFAPDPVLSAEMLSGLIFDLEKHMPAVAPKKPEARVYTTISISQVLETLTSRIEQAMKTSFSQIAVASPDADDKSRKVYTIVSFLGMLELVRRGLVDAQQDVPFEDIALARSAEETSPASLQTL
ncbi:segregation/condensation protein A [Candidatus Nomurabacteria bacterium]|nr:segregation/condensation protein A [Candidatus Nomurabacteria bacterium]